MKDFAEMPEMYPADILAYAEDPRRWSRESVGQQVIKAYNPLCGDKYEIRFDLETAIVRPTFHGYGCVLSKASHAILLDLMDGQSIQETIDMIECFTHACQGIHTGEDLDIRLLSFLQVRKYPARMDCVLLGWRAVHAALSNMPSRQYPVHA